jgi:hypothetical protein
MDTIMDRKIWGSSFLGVLPRRDSKVVGASQMIAAKGAEHLDVIPIELS